MAHPEMAPAGTRSANYSPLMAKKARAKGGEIINACPFGCEHDQLDEHGICRHLIGYSNEDKAKNYEPLVRRKGIRIVQIPEDVVGKDEDGFPIVKKILPATPKGCQFVRITTSYRVYFEHPETLKKPEAGEQLKKPA